MRVNPMNPDAMNPDALEVHRQSFPALGNKHYFNYGGQGPMAVEAIAAIQATYAKIQEIGPFSTAANAFAMELGHRLRVDLGKLLGVPTPTVTLTEDVTVGCNIALWGFDWRSGDEIVLSDCEHPGIIASVRELQRRFGVVVRIWPLGVALGEGVDPVPLLAERFGPRTRLVVLSHVLWNTGDVLPLGAVMALCRGHRGEYPLRVLVDAAQSVGMVPLDLLAWDVDFYAFTGHKWLGGPEGVGGLYVSEAARSELHPTYGGWRGIVMDEGGEPLGWKPDGQRYEVATSAYPLFAGLRAAIAVQAEFASAQERYGRILALGDRLWRGLGGIARVNPRLKAAPSSGLVAFELEGMDPLALVTGLEEQGMMTRVILSPRCVRACVHYLTLESEVDALVEAIRRSLA